MLTPEEYTPIICPTCAEAVSLDPPYYGIGGKWYCSAECAKRGETIKLQTEYAAEIRARALFQRSGD